MKKYLFFTVLAAMLLMSLTSALGAAVSEDYDTGYITVTGETQTDMLLGIQVLTPGNEWKDFVAEKNKRSMVVYNDQIVTGDCKYELIFAINGESGTYKIYIVPSEGEMECIDFRYISPRDYTNFLERLNAAAASSDSDSFYNEIVSNEGYFGTDFDKLKAEIDFKQAMNMFCEYVKSSPLKSENEIKPNTAYNAYIAIEAAQEGKLKLLREYAYNLPRMGALDKWLSLIFDKPEALEHMQSVLNSLKPRNVNELSDDMTEAVVLSIVKYPGGYENTVKIINEFKSFLDIETVTTAACRKISGNGYMTKEQLKNALEAPESSGTSGGTGGTGGKGGSGGSKLLSGGSIPEIKYSPGENADKEEKKIFIPFEDIYSVQWAREAITALYDKKLINGRTETRFYPDDSITREEFVKMIVSAAGLEQDFQSDRFEDVPADAWYRGYVNAAFRNGLITGTDDKTFGSGQNITRQDMAVIIYNAMKIKPEEKSSGTFSDGADISGYAREAVSRLSGCGIINGTDGGRFEPLSCATRAQAAKMLYGALKYME
ncbi:MAG: S-layer homology domain-containing protein [Clostridia bacterium]|nr:S-layer homology domain-containing protein [Clostridia bacterium]